MGRKGPHGRLSERTTRAVTIAVFAHPTDAAGTNGDFEGGNHQHSQRGCQWARR